MLVANFTAGAVLAMEVGEGYNGYRSILESPTNIHRADFRGIGRRVIVVSQNIINSTITLG